MNGLHHCGISRVIRALCIAVLGFVWAALPAQAQKTYVVAVGLGDYKYPSIAPSLPCTVNDAKAISHFFNDYNGSRVFMLLNENATRSHILQVLKSEFSKSTPNDEIIFVFCGHGVQGGLTTYETRDYDTIITYNQIQNIMKAAKARRKIILAMACYSGGLNLNGSKNRGNGNGNRKTDKTSVMIYSSSRASEPSWVSSEMRNSFFMTRMLEAFHGAADVNHDRKITARELFNYVNPAVISDTQGLQHPQLWGNFDDSMVVVYVK